MSGTGILPSLFERLARGEVDDAADDTRSARASRDFDREALAASVRAELLRLFNTRRGARARTVPPTVIDYGVADWTALYPHSGDDRRRLAREVHDAVQRFEPRLQLDDVEALPPKNGDDDPQRLRLRLTGCLNGGVRRWPAVFVVESDGGELEIRHERLD